MAGHSQFKNIMHRKGRKDKARSKLFGKLAREITTAAKLGQPDPAFNPRLRAAIIAARAENMTKDVIERAIRKSQGGDAEHYDEMRYEGYGPGGVAVIVEVLTDNKNRTAGEIRQIFTKHGGALGEAGSVAYLFKPRGVILVDKGAVGEEALMEIVLEAGADDVNSEGDSFEVLTPPATLEAVKEALAKKGIATLSAELSRVASQLVTVTAKDAGQLLKLVDTLEEHDDVQKVYANFNVPDEILAKLAH